MRQLLSSNLKPIKKAKSTRLREFGTVWSMLESQKVTYQSSTIKFYGKITLRKKTPKSLHQLYSSFKSWSVLSIKTTLKNQQRPHASLTQLQQWLGQLFSLRLRPPNKNVAEQPNLMALINALKRANFYLVFGPVSLRSKKSFLSYVTIYFSVFFLSTFTRLRGFCHQDTYIL